MYKECAHQAPRETILELLCLTIASATILKEDLIFLFECLEYPFGVPHQHFWWQCPRVSLQALIPHWLRQGSCVTEDPEVSCAGEGSWDEMILDDDG